ncbi:MAG: hypothetical protein NTX66_03230 [Candidatus Falkowbacteria bacterium]|nr:hypothetical protein [Candidatus Falkowbacteria bacterium]
MLGSILFSKIETARAQMAVTDPAVLAAILAQSAKQAAAEVKTVVKDKIWKILLKAASKAFQVTLRRALNKVAYDYATALGSGDWGQQPLFQAKDWGTYFGDVADEAAGGFIESFANDFSQENDIKMQEIGKQETTAYNTQQGCLATCGASWQNKDPNCTGTMCERITVTDTNSPAAVACQSNCRKSYTATMGPINEQKKTLSKNPIATCQPSSIDVKLRIALGLAQVSKPAAPNCTATQMVKNWQTAYDQYADYERPGYLTQFSSIFNPVSNDLGIYMTLKSDLLSKEQEKKANETLQASIGQGYTDKRNIAGNLISIPNKSRLDTEASGQMYVDNFGKYTGDAFIDAANIFINQAALTSFNKLMSSLGDKVKKKSESAPPPPPEYCALHPDEHACYCALHPTDYACTNSCDPVTDPSCAPVNYGEGNVQEAAASLIRPSFTTQADYNILASLSACVDAKNPGPTECVIDERFLQAITEKKTVAEALKEGFLNKDWLISSNSQDANSYNVRNINILRKYRILPIGWEEAANKSEKLNKKVTLMDLVSCFDPNDSYNEFGNEFDVRNQAWCEGLIDPNWVLKSPLGYCRKQGIGNQIQSTQIIPGQPAQGGVPATPSSLNVSRVEDYCADEQTCIKEKADGTCDAYGYCNSEKRTWTFGNDSCDPVSNTCQTFTKTNGTSVSYLKNTLDYGNCGADNAGCQAYSWTGVYSATSSQVAWDATKKIYLNNNAGTCSADEEACTGLLRVKPSWGSNLIMNASFDNDALGDLASTGCVNSGSNPGASLNDWYFRSETSSICSAEIIDIANLGGSVSNKALKLSIPGGDIGVYSNPANNHSLLPTNFAFLPDQSYTLSADVYLVSGDKVDLWIGNLTNPPSNFATANTKDSWQHLSFTKTAADGINDPEFALKGSASSGNVEFYVKNLKFELSDYDTGWKLYGAYHVYEKILPPYLEAACYTNSGSGVSDYTLKPGAPSICSSFARKCNKNEAGCELYSSLDNFAVPAQVAPTDYCPQECLGYDTYVSKRTYFNSPLAENLIPKTAQTCSAASAGCSEFTNLDETAKGGEQKEYYSFLKQCIKPDTSVCGDFYVWNNGNESGYQLQALSLKVDSSTNPADSNPYVVESDNALCDAAIFNALPSDPAYNPDCRQFYNKAGDVSYHLISRTVTCSDDCKTYRMSAKNIDSKLTTLAACDTSSDQHFWDTSNSTCYVCLNGGTWDNNQQACTYKAIPSEGTSCAAKDNGCREFNGNRGNNLRLIKSYDFENGVTTWLGLGSATTSLSADSNNKDGHSLKFDPGTNNPGAMKIDLGNSVQSQGAYVIKFIAKAQADTDLNIAFNNGVASDETGGLFGTTNPSLQLKGDNEWHIYQVNLNVLNHEVSATETLEFSANHVFKLDNIILQEISDKYYLISQSSVIPDICYYDMLDKYQGADYNLGCSAYADRNKVQNNLHQFSHLCQDSAVGCEMMINTQNYGPYNSKIFNDANANGVCDSNEADCVKVAQDSVVYAVFDQSKQCNSADQGCARLGQAQKQGSNWYFSDIYKKNNPDTYDKSLCQEASVGCSQWQDTSGAYNYFKDPGLNTCVYRNSNFGNGIKKWFRAPVNRCDLNDDGQIKNVINFNEAAGSICLSDGDCSNGHKCLVDNNDYDCPVSYLKTIGYGGVNNQIPTPDGAAGSCEPIASGCTEYIDPISRFASNLIFNPSFEDLNSDGTRGDGWKNGSFDGPALIANEQVVSILAGKLYKFQFSDDNNNQALQFKCLNNFRLLGSNNKFGDPAKSFNALANNPYFILSPINNTCLVVGGYNDGTKIRNFELKEAVISYQKQAEVDKKSCNGIVNFDNGCVLFNERSQNGAAGPANLGGAWNATVSFDRNSPANCSATSTNANVCIQGGSCSSVTTTLDNCNANQLIKVRPDRVCGGWLDCTSYSIDPQTKGKTCYSVGQCDRLDDKQECASFVKPVATSTTAHNFNLGNDKNTTGYSLLDSYYLPNMKEVGPQTDAHYDFESRNVALACTKPDGSACRFDKNINEDLIMIEPDKSPVDYPAHGKGYLKVPANYIISPLSNKSYITVLKNQDYYINYLVNTKEAKSFC